MILFPAIDLKDGECVRLKQGDMDRVTIYDDNPGARAAHFEKLGFEYLHIVDLNGAFEGKPVNSNAVDDILASISIPTQLGGGIRDLKTIENWLKKGISRVILGTIATKNPEIVKKACMEFPGQIVIGIDARDSNVAVEGWAEASNIDVIELAQKFADCGASAIIYTDINRDGLLTGLNIESTLRLAKNTHIPVIASGGLSSIKDIERLTEDDCKILEGAITGRALYDGRLDAKEALNLLINNLSK